MRPDAIRRIQHHYLSMAPRMDEVAKVCYRILFEKHPELRPLFPADTDRLAGHFAAAIALICRNLDRLAFLEGPLMALGAQHVEYGARPEHYPRVCEVIIQALEEVSAEAFTPRLRADWSELLDRVSGAMLRGAAGAGLGVSRGLLTHSSWGMGAVPGRTEHT